MSINKKNNKKNMHRIDKADTKHDVNQDTEDFFGDDFEVIYEDDLSDLIFDEEEDTPDDWEDDDDWEDNDDWEEGDDWEDNEDDREEDPSDRRKQSGKKRSGSRKNTDDSDDRKRKKKRRGLPNLVSPAAKTAKAGGKAIYKAVNFLLRIATLILIAVIIYVLGAAFWTNHSVYGNILLAVSEKNYTLAAYTGVALFLILFEVIAFLIVLFSGKKGVRKGEAADTGRGLFSFIFIFAGSVLAGLFGGLLPASPAPLLGVQGALSVYGSLRSALFPLCAAGVVSCLVRKFVIR